MISCDFLLLFDDVIPIALMSFLLKKYARISEMWLMTDAMPKSVGVPWRSCRCQKRKVNTSPTPKPMNQVRKSTEPMRTFPASIEIYVRWWHGRVKRAQVMRRFTYLHSGESS